MAIDDSSDERGIAVWSTAAWREQAVAWLDEQLAAAGIERTGEVEQPRVRPWATVLKVPTTEGTFWLKAAVPATAFEVPLYPLLHQVAPDHVLEPLATDVTRGWIVLPDGGEHLGDLLTGDALVDAIAAVLPRYAELQRSLAPDTESLAKLGVVDMRPSVMSQRFEEALEASTLFVEPRRSAEDRETLARLAELRPSIARWSDRLTASPVPTSIDHNDLHPWNVLVRDADALDRACFYDWGDSVVAHPFASMLLPLRTVQDHLQVALDDKRLLRVRDAYLEAFSDFGRHAELVETLELACHLGKIARSIVWVRTLAMEEHEDQPFAKAPMIWLSNLLDESYLGDE